ncbi:hypothetical protein C5167_036281 [Papaver somniferum]|nr:hypothetical protein C5167_036281 [Papaver somniferum]
MGLILFFHGYAADPGPRRNNIIIGVCAAIGASLLTVLAFILFRRWRRRNDLHKNSTLISRSISPDLVRPTYKSFEAFGSPRKDWEALKPYCKELWPPSKLRIPFRNGQEDKTTSLIIPNSRRDASRYPEFIVNL